MIRKHWEFEQQEPTSVWEVNNIPENAKQPVITHIVTNEGQILQPDNQLLAPYGIQLSFGVQQVAGIAYGTYYLDEDSTVIEGNGGVIHVTINQNNSPRV